MSRENVDLTQEAFERFNRGDNEAAILEDLFDPAAVWHVRDDEPDAGAHQGHDSIRGMWGSWQEMFVEFRAEPEEYIDAGDSVVAPGWLSGRGRDSGLTIREPYTWVFTWGDGKVVEVREYRTKAEALEAVGLSGYAMDMSAAEEPRREATPAAVVHAPGGGEHLGGPSSVTIKATGDDTGGSFYLGEVELEPGFAGPPPHVHERLHDMFYVLNGTLSMRVGESTCELQPGAFACVPPGVVHTFANPSERPVRFLNFNTPAGWENYMRELAPLLTADTPDPEEIGRIASRYDFRIA